MNHAQFLNPDRVLDNIDVHGGMQVADLGSGAGHFTIAAARRLGREGLVRAFDVQQTALDALRSHARRIGLYNIETLWTDLERPQSTKLPENTIDLAILSNVLFQVPDKRALIEETARILRPGGKVLVVEWNATATPVGPRIKERIPKDSLRNLMQETGLKFVREIQTGAYHYSMIFEKS